MCYDVVSSTLSKLKYALHRGDMHRADELISKLLSLQHLLPPYHHITGFAHPPLLVFTNQAPLSPQGFTWGLIPSWVKDGKTAKTTMNQTLNARGETIFEKAAFRHAALKQRCLVYIDAFYEHHHAGKQTFPFRIGTKDQSPMALAGLWEEWTDGISGETIKTVSIVTTRANDLMSKIHNHPKAGEPRMPVILPQEKQDEWLIDCKTEADRKHLENLLVPLDENLLTFHPVSRLKGKQALGNVPEAQNPVDYGLLFWDF